MHNYNNDSNHLPSVIYVAESPEQARNYIWLSGAEKLDKNIAILEPNKIKELGKDKEHFYLPYDLTPGEVLVRHPYNQGYILATDAEEQYLSASAEGIFLAARCLGATKISYVKHNISEYKREINTNGEVEYKAVKTDYSIKHTTEEKLLNMIKMTRTFPKQDFSKCQFDKAKSILEERGLFLSREIRSLIDARDPEMGCPMSSQTIHTKISSSLNKVLDVAFSLKVLPTTFSLNSTTKIAIEKKMDIEVEWEIIFD